MRGVLKPIALAQMIGVSGSESLQLLDISGSAPISGATAL
jgi:hypothetical protein